MASYRPNVAAIFRKPKNGRILIGQRNDFKGCWQFPQGGVDKGEDLIGALQREVEEEVGVPPNLYDIVACRTGYRYKFPKGHLKKGLWCGQEQTYFLCDYWGKKSDIKLDLHVREFATVQWIDPKEFELIWVPKFKRAVFKRVFKDFFGVKPKTRRKQKPVT
ncbi:MAG: RNA pyrophosphohydrolase [Verrucomicrobiales bacterium]|nr:RNA pyrophosphohydrolase [Verrucomicrobiales bacterium]